MKAVPFDELQVGMFVVMVKASSDFPGLANRLFKVVAIDDPYVAIETGSGGAKSTHLIVGRNAAFAQPSKEILSAVMPDEFILDAEVIGDE